MVTIFYLFVIEQVLQSLYSLWQGMTWLAMARRRMEQPSSFYTPRVALFCPVKGLEPGLEQNLLALTEFDYLSYEIFFPVASAQDPANPILERVAAASRRTVHIVRAGAPKDCAEKVNNLRVAVETAGREFDVLVFTDSDGRPSRRWLSRMVAPLSDDGVGAATTFRWFIPNSATKMGTFWSGLASAWNAPVATYLGEHQNNFCWGGGMAIRRDRFEEIHVAEAWHGSVSDDLSLTGAVNAAGFTVTFVPECLVPSFIQLSARGLFEFTERQIVIARVYSPKLWLTAAVSHLLYCGSILMGIGLWLANWATGSPSLQFLLLALIPPVLSAIRGIQRLVAVLDLLPEYRNKLLAYAWAWTIAAPLVPFISLYDSVVAVFRRRIKWRGIRYDLVSTRDTRIVPH